MISKGKPQLYINKKLIKNKLKALFDFVKVYILNSFWKSIFTLPIQKIY